MRFNFVDMNDELELYNDDELYLYNGDTGQDETIRCHDLSESERGVLCKALNNLREVLRCLKARKQT